MFCETINLLSQANIYPDDISTYTNILPNAFKRRISLVSKMAFIASKLALENEAFDHIIFASQHGELDNTLSILKQLEAQEILSPTKFSQSVHNTACGLFSIDQNINTPANSVAAGADTFFMALIDGIAYLIEHPNKKVLLTIYDQPMVEEYKALDIKFDYGVALALILTKENRNKNNVNTIKLDISSNKANANLKQAHPVDQLITFIESNSINLQQQSEHYHFNWTKETI